MAIQWTIQTKDTNVELDGMELLVQLIQRSMQEQRPTHEELVKCLVNYLQTQGALGKCNAEQLALIALDVGYFYRVFLEKNKVSIGNTNEESNPVS